MDPPARSRVRSFPGGSAARRARGPFTHPSLMHIAALTGEVAGIWHVGGLLIGGPGVLAGQLIQMPSGESRRARRRPASLIGVDQDTSRTWHPKSSASALTSMAPTP